MVLIPGLLGGAAAGGGARNFFGLDDQFISGFNPEQARVSNLLGSRLEALLSQGPRQFQGDLTVPFGAGEQQALDRFNRLAALSESRLSGLIDEDEPAFRERFRGEIVQPAFRTFREEVQPLIEESLPSFSTARGRAVQRGAQQLSNQLLQQRFAAREATRERSIRAIQEAQSLGRTDLALNAVPREIKQLGLDRQYAEFVRSNAQFAQDINSAVSFLGLDTQTFIPGRDPIELFLAAARAGASAASAAGGGA